MGIESKLIDRLALANERYEVEGELMKRCDDDETNFNRAVDERLEAEEAVLAIRSELPEIMKAQIAILARRAAAGLDVASELAAIAAT